VILVAEDESIVAKDIQLWYICGSAKLLLPGEDAIQKNSRDTPGFV